MSPREQPSPSGKGPRDRAGLERQADDVAVKSAFGGTRPSPGTVLSHARAAVSRPAGTRDAGPAVREVGDQLGYDFSGVRLHDGPAAASIAASERAHAVAHGSDIYFAPGHLRPDVPLGRALIAHELAHVVQQGAAPRIGGRDEELAAHDQLHEDAVRPVEGWSTTRMGCDCSKSQQQAPQQQQTGSAQQPTPPPPPAPRRDAAQLDANYGMYYQQIEDAVTEVHAFADRFCADPRRQPTPRPTRVDTDRVRAMMGVETRNAFTDAARTHVSVPRAHDPLQIANQSDHALSALQTGRGGRHTGLLIDPSITQSLQGVGHTLGAAHDQTPTDGRFIAPTESIRGGVAWLYANAAEWDNDPPRIVEDSQADEFVDVIDADQERIWNVVQRLHRAGIETTVETVQSLNGNPRRIRTGDRLRYHRAHSEPRLTGWKSWDDATRAYNGGGNPQYLSEVLTEEGRIAAQRAAHP